LILSELKCRVCSDDLSFDPILTLSKVPNRAQYFLDSPDIQTKSLHELKIHQCMGCGLVQLKNKPVSYYREVIRAISVSKEMLEFRNSQFSEFVKNFELEGKRIIEIGCGKGDYLSILKRLNVKSFGLEFSDRSVQYCRDIGLKVNQGFLDDMNISIQGSPYNGFIVLSFLEHLPQPIEFLRGIKNNISQEGCGIIEVPNFEMISKNNLFSEFINDHLCYFTKNTLHTAIKIAGFELLQINTILDDYIISAQVKKNKLINLNGMNRNLDKIKMDFYTYLDKYKKVAIWGAGHQALSIMGLINLKDKIRYVVDSADFKQNKYTPGTNIPIYSPKHLRNDPVDAIIVIGGSYSEEIAKIISEKYSMINEISILKSFGLEKLKIKLN